MSDPNPANLSRESRRILSESSEFGNVAPSDSLTTASPTIPSAGFLDDATEVALAAYDDVYTAEYVAAGAIDNKTIAMRAAVEAVIALCAMECEAEQRVGCVRELVEIADDSIVIRIPIDALPSAAILAWKKYGQLCVTRTRVFAQGVVAELRREKENGDTLVTDMLDAAVIRAVEYGAEGCALGGAER
jgi:hypothetical protein